MKPTTNDLSTRLHINTASLSIKDRICSQVDQVVRLLNQNSFRPQTKSYDILDRKDSLNVVIVYNGGQSTNVLFSYETKHALVNKRLLHAYIRRHIESTHQLVPLNCTQNTTCNKVKQDHHSKRDT